MPKTALLASFAWFACFVAALPAQRVWIVDQAGGPGVDFTAIEPAMVAASPGDRVEVRGPYAYGSFNVRKGLDVEATGGASVPTMGILNVPAGEWARVAGFRVTGDFFVWAEPLVAIQCSGQVLLSRMVISSIYPVPAVHLTRCSHVLLLDCTVLGGTSNGKASYAGPALVADDTSLAAQRCRFEGGRAGNSQGFNIAPGPPGGYGLVARRSAVFAARTQCLGGDGGLGRGGFNQCPGPGVGGTGAWVDSVALFMDGCTLRGGRTSNQIGCPIAGDGPALNSAGPTAHVTQDAIIQGALLNALLIPPLTAISSPGSGTRGTTATLTINGPAGTIVLMHFDRLHDHLVLSGVDGPWLLTGRAVGLALLGIGSNGTLLMPLAIPNDLALRNQWAFFQAVAVTPTQQVSLTSLGDLRIR
jgi:hypothetical protein